MACETGLTRRLRATFDDVPVDLTGWFLDRDTYGAKGYLSLNELYDGLLQLPMGLIPHQISVFLTDIIDKNDGIQLDILDISLTAATELSSRTAMHRGPMDNLSLISTL